MFLFSSNNWCLCEDVLAEQWPYFQLTVALLYWASCLYKAKCYNSSQWHKQYKYQYKYFEEYEKGY